MQIFSRKSILSLATMPLVAVAGLNAGAIKDYLHVPGPVVFDKASYSLAWSAHPSAIYYKQEYVPAGEHPEDFHKMMLIEALQSNMPLQNAVGGKIQEITDRRKTDPVADYRIVANSDNTEYILEFLMSTGTGEASVVEWNAYRYRQVTLNGQPAIFLFANSLRAYGAGKKEFLSSLPATRARVIEELKNYRLPLIDLH